MKKKLLFVGLFFVSAIAFSHEFWLQPLKYLLAVNQSTFVDIFVGEGFIGEKSDATKYTVQQLKHFSIGGNEDIRANLLANDRSRFNVRFATPGNHLVSFNNSNKFIQLPANEFNAYLREEGLHEVLQQRINAGDSAKDGRELYQRCVKTLFLVGNKTDSTCSRHTGLRLELIPGSNPYAISGKGNISFTVLFDNKPVSNALVLIWNSAGGKSTVKKYRSDREGTVEFPISNKGRWMISTVKMIPHTNTSEADWQSFWGSYTFGWL